MSAPVSTFSFPTTTLFGAGTLAELPARLSAAGLRRPLVVTDAGLLPTRAFAALQSALGQGVTVFSGVHPNPVEADVSAAARAFREQGCDVVVAFGGGSALDAGKACRLFLKRPDLQLAKYNYSDDWSGLAPCICIPTTAVP
jgi:4-hydroxybutyrate dehydrogenase